MWQGVVLLSGLRTSWWDMKKHWSLIVFGLLFDQFAGDSAFNHTCNLLALHCGMFWVCTEMSLCGFQGW